MLNQLAAWWFERTADIVANHVVSVPDPNVLDRRRGHAHCRSRWSCAATSPGSRRRRCGASTTTVPARSTATTSPTGCARTPRCPTPIITPTTKAEGGAHDEPITCAESSSKGLVEPELWARGAGRRARGVRPRPRHAAAAGLILADTKYEFGLGPDGELLLIDEVHTPDSSRFWVADDLRGAPRRRRGAREPRQGADPQVARRRRATGATARRRRCPPTVVAETSARYIRAYETLTGHAFERAQSAPVATPHHAQALPSGRQSLLMID